jgi:hypothetical protein
MNKITKVTAAALAALAMGACKTTFPGPSGAHGGAAESEKTPAKQPTADAGKKGECWGINACKGQGACGGADGHECAGQNACKGQGWLSLTKPDCDAKGGKFKAG